MPVNWAYSGDWSNFTSFNDIFLQNYRDVADQFGLVLCPVMGAYQTMVLDVRHPTDMSTYMAACMEYGLIFGEDPVSITSHPSSVSDADAADMRARASKVLAEFNQTVSHHAATVALKSTVTDAFGLVLPQDNVEYSVSDANASVSPEGVFHATEPC